MNRQRCVPKPNGSCRASAAQRCDNQRRPACSSRCGPGARPTAGQWRGGHLPPLFAMVGAGPPPPPACPSGHSANRTGPPHHLALPTQHGWKAPERAADGGPEAGRYKSYPPARAGTGVSGLPGGFSGLPWHPAPFPRRLQVPRGAGPPGRKAELASRRYLPAPPFRVAKVGREPATVGRDNPPLSGHLVCGRTLRFLSWTDAG